MFIVHCKSHCRNDTFDARLTSLLAKNIYEEQNSFYVVRISISLAILSFKLLTYYKSYARKQEWLFFFLNSVYKTFGTHGQTGTQTDPACSMTPCKQYRPPDCMRPRQQVMKLEDKFSGVARPLAARCGCQICCPSVCGDTRQPIQPYCLHFKA